jgi:hypothetical protein
MTITCIGGRARVRYKYITCNAKPYGMRPTHMSTYVRLTLKWIFDEIFEKEGVKMHSGFHWFQTASPILRK